MRYCIIKTGSGRSLLCSLCCTRGFVMGWCRKIGNACMYDDNANYWLWWPQRKCSTFLILVTGSKWGVLALLFFFIILLPLKKDAMARCIPSVQWWRVVCIWNDIQHGASRLTSCVNTRPGWRPAVSSALSHLCRGALSLSVISMNWLWWQLWDQWGAYNQTSFDTSIRSEICCF